MNRDLIIDIMRSELTISSDNLIKEDFLKFTSVKRMINQYIIKNKMNHNLIINNIITLFNRYNSSCYKIFVLLLDEQQLSIINPFFVFLGLEKEVTIMDYDIVRLLKIFADENYIHEHFLKDC